MKQLYGSIIPFPPTLKRVQIIDSFSLRHSNESLVVWFEQGKVCGWNEINFSIFCTREFELN